jgi:hypothetical protein
MPQAIPTPTASLLMTTLHLSSRGLARKGDCVSEGYLNRPLPGLRWAGAVLAGRGPPQHAVKCHGKGINYVQGDQDGTGKRVKSRLEEHGIQ